MSSSSMGVRNTRGHASSDGNERIVAPMKCGCGSVMLLLTSKREHSYEKKIFTCPNNWKGVGGCRFFMWYEQEVSPYDRIWKELKFGNKLLLGVIVMLVIICLMKIFM